MSKVTKQKIISRVKKQTGIKIDMFRQTFSWVAVYDDQERGIYETHTICVMWLRDMSLDQWVEECAAFVSDVKAQHNI